MHGEVMPKRKGLSNKIRFEVFKRDSFKCQYCGQSAPDIVLQVDHINPVARGGKNSMTNLITSCQSCNGGKGATRLDDNSAVVKQRLQMEQLNERRAQLTMMMNWREELDNLEDGILEQIVNDINARFKCRITDSGKKQIKSCIKKFGVADTQEAVRCCEEQYLKEDSKGIYTRESQEKAFHYISRVASGIAMKRKDPVLSRLLYAMGIIRNRFSYHPHDALNRLKRAYQEGFDTEEIIHYAKTCRNWTQFSNVLDGGE